ncbi:MAG: transcriptional regulator [Bacteroidota bacterium]|nr:transcriptional regulator [Bacteroidota bacterium]
MNYLDLIKKFWSEDVKISYSSMYMYFYLLEMWDNNDEDAIEISDNKLMEIIKISRVTIQRCRIELRDMGLISFKITIGYTTSYKIITDYTITKPKQEIKTQTEVKVKKQEKVAIEPKKKETTQNTTIKEVKQEPPIQPIQPPATVTSEKITEVPKVQVAEKKEAPKEESKSIYPTLEEFMDYARTLPPYDSSLDFALESKYEFWKESGWMNGYNKPITNWKLTLNNTIPFLKGGGIIQPKVPKIIRPKTTYNE